jgi:uncharacterized repeat protein (TIGR03803 family)
LIQVGSALYGTTFHTGNFAAGEVYQYDPSTSTVTPIVTFPSIPNGLFGPTQSLLGLGSTLYGLTYGGGPHQAGGIFTYDTSGGTYASPYQFAGSPSDGSAPVGSLIQSGSTFYGVTQNGGSHGPGGYGSIFSYGPNTGSESVLYSFKAGTSDIAYPDASPVLVGGTLYGASSSSGSHGYGGIYQYNLATNTESLAYSFNNSGVGGIYPAPSMVLSGTTLYGAASGGGADGAGVLFKFDLLTNQESVLYTFSGGTSDGSGPAAPILSGSVLYGVTSAGGATGNGTVYAYDLSSNEESILYSFGGGTTDGSQGTGQLLQVGNTLYGATYEGGTNGGGTLFSVTVPEPGCAAVMGVCALALLARRHVQGSRHPFGSTD